MGMFHEIMIDLLLKRISTQATSTQVESTVVLTSHKTCSIVSELCVTRPSLTRSIPHTMAVGREGRCKRRGV